MTSQFVDMTLSSIFFEVDVFLLSNLVTGPRFMSMSWLVLELWQFSFIRWLTRNPEIGNTPVWGAHNIWRMGRVRDTKFDRNVSNKKLLITAKCKGYSFHRFWVINGKLTEGYSHPSIQSESIDSLIRASAWYKIH